MFHLRDMLLQLLIHHYDTESGMLQYHNDYASLHRSDAVAVFKSVSQQARTCFTCRQRRQAEGLEVEQRC